MLRRLTILRAALPVTCPSCGAKISWRYASLHAQFLCPECGQGVHIREDRYFRVLNFSLLVVGWVAYAAGARDEVLFWSVLLGTLPVAFVVHFITMRIFPPDAEATGDYRGILYGPHGHAPHQRGQLEDEDRKDSAPRGGTPPSVN